MIRVFKSQRGSSTILIALVLIALVVFGVLSVTTTSSEYKLAQRNAQTQANYYILDSEAVRFVYRIKELMKTAQENANDELNAIEQNREAAKLPKEVTKILIETRNKAKNRDVWAQQAYDKLYCYFLQNLINANIEGVRFESGLGDAASNEFFYSDNAAFHVLLSKTLVLSDNGRNMNLDVRLSLLRPEKGTDINEQCLVKEWRLWQEPFEYKQSVDLWEGTP